MANTRGDPTTQEAASEPTQYDKIRAIPWSLGYDLANTFFGQLTFFNSAATLRKKRRTPSNAGSLPVGCCIFLTPD